MSTLKVLTSSLFSLSSFLNLTASPFPWHGLMGKLYALLSDLLAYSINIQSIQTSCPIYVLLLLCR